jgi:chemotaxis protein histidine kinase CheA/ActR/RegA family two-component response regulator
VEQTTTIHETFDSIRSCLQDGGDGVIRASEAADYFRGIAQAAHDASRPELAEFSELLARLMMLAQSLNDARECGEETASVQSFVHEALDCFAAVLNDDAEAAERMFQLRQQADERWGECLNLLGTMEEVSEEAEFWQSTSTLDTHTSGEITLDPGQIGLILSSLHHEPPADNANHGARPQPVAAKSAKSRSRQAKVPSAARSAPAAPAEGLSLALADADIRDAFLDDAGRGLAAIESCLLAYEADTSNRQPLQQVCRELHTLKGASASVGLEKLAQYLHQVEDDLQTACDTSGAVELQSIFQAVDAVRAQMNRCLEAPTAGDAAAHPSSGGRALVDRFVDTGNVQDSVRVKAAQLDRLMDMLAELVMLRNRRESRVQQLKSVHSELVRCVSRLRAYEENYSTVLAVSGSGASHTEHAAVRGMSAKQRVSSLTEIANDLLELGGSLRELYEPVSDENLAISRFIRQFRQELIQLRRVPITGLFQRLQRAARDAARVEQKKVRLQLIGEHVGLDASLQQQLYEPLLHIVRNAVSHGIEPEARRVAAGKQPVGTLTLEAHGGSNMLAVTVRDDGQGLDYDALRRRGVEMGLLSPNRPASHTELARLIFHPGFSTRTAANEISGRGVGMDVVAAALERMHSWIEVDSAPGYGTTVRLLIPLHSVIEHVTVFRAGRQEFAIPTQFVKFAGDPTSIDTSEFPLTRLSRLFSFVEPSITDQPQLLVLAQGRQLADATGDATGPDGTLDGRQELRLGILVDQILGPEEVVVRPLPGLLSRQRLLSGVTLSGTGDIMLLFDSQQLLERGLRQTRDPRREPEIIDVPSTNRGRPRARVLVVDDSRSSRRTLIRCLDRFDFEIDEAADGIDALRRLKEVSYDLVFTDLEMPQMGGMELLREIRAGIRTADTPVVIVSSRGEDVFRQQARDLRVSDYLTKPVSEAIVVQAIERLNHQHERTNL